MKKWSFRHLFASIYAGCSWFTLGCVMLILGYPTHLNDSNLYLLLSMLLILAGVVVIVTSYKRKSRY